MIDIERVSETYVKRLCASGGLCHEEEWQRSNWVQDASLLRGTMYNRGIYDGNELVGLISYEIGVSKHTRKCVINLIEVKEGYRNKGIGTRVLEYLFGMNGVTEIRGDVLPEGLIFWARKGAKFGVDDISQYLLEMTDNDKDEKVGIPFVLSKENWERYKH